MRNVHKLALLSPAQILHAEGVLTSEELLDVEREHQECGECIGEILLARSLTTEYEMAKAIVSQLQLPYLQPAAYDIPEELRSLLPAAFLRQHRIVPLDKFGDILVVATCGDITAQLITEIETDTKLKVCFVISTKSEIELVLKDKFPQLDMGKEVASRLDQLFGR